MEEQKSRGELRPVLSPPETCNGLSFLYGSAFGGIILRLLTCRFISLLAGKYLDSRFSRRKIKKFIERHGIDISQYESEQYKNFNAFFTRRIKPEFRPVNYSPEAFIAPCDGYLSVYTVDDNTVFNVKGFDYTVESLLKNADLSKFYGGGGMPYFPLNGKGLSPLYLR